MRNPYYVFWADAIRRYRKHHPNDKDWDARVFVLNTWVHGLNFWTIVLWLKYFGILIIPPLEIDLFPGDLLDNLIAFIIEFVLFWGILNYFLIFHKKRYKKILLKYGEFKTNYAVIYGITITLLSFFSAILYSYLNNWFK